MESIIAIYFLIGVFSIVGICLLISGIKSYKKASNAKHFWMQKEGTVIKLDIVKSRSSKGRTTTSYHPVYEYTVGSNKYEFKSIMSCNPKKLNVGHKANVLYNPENHQEAVLENDKSYLVFIIIGIVFASFGLGTLLLLAFNVINI